MKTTGRVSSFNPTLVRLRLFPPGSWWTTPMSFQSHAGSIEAKDRNYYREQNREVTIPRWFD